MQVGQDILNFIITGEIRSGSTVIQSSINNHAGGMAVCHGDLFHADEAVLFVLAAADIQLDGRDRLGLWNDRKASLHNYQTMSSCGE